MRGETWVLFSGCFLARYSLHSSCDDAKDPGCWMPRGSAEDNRAHCPWLCVVTSAPGSFTTLMVVQTSGWPSQAHLLWISQDKWTYDLHPICESPQTCRGLPGQSNDFKILWPWSCHLITREDQRRHVLPTLLGKGVLGIFRWSLTYFSSFHLLKSNRDEDSKKMYLCC